jgi:hypothetical protein
MEPAHRKVLDIRPGCHHIARQFVPEHGGRHDHPRMITAAEYLDVGAASQRHSYPNENVAVIDLRNGHWLYLQVFLAVEHTSHHLRFHCDHLCG